MSVLQLVENLKAKARELFGKVKKPEARKNTATAKGKEHAQPSPAETPDAAQNPAATQTPAAEATNSQPKPTTETATEPFPDAPKVPATDGAHQPDLK